MWTWNKNRRAAFPFPVFYVDNYPRWIFHEAVTHRICLDTRAAGAKVKRGWEQTGVEPLNVLELVPGFGRWGQDVAVLQLTDTTSGGFSVSFHLLLWSTKEPRAKMLHFLRWDSFLCSPPPPTTHTGFQLMPHITKCNVPSDGLNHPRLNL